jgi:biopolymer transport protein ExbB/TolQ
MVDPITMFKGGGPFMYAILFVAIAAFAIAGERIYQVMSRYSINSTDFMG